MPQTPFYPMVSFQPSAYSLGSEGFPVLGNTSDPTGGPPKKPRRKKPKKKQPIWLVPVLAGSGVLLLGGVVLFALSRKRKGYESPAIPSTPVVPVGVPL